MLLSWWWGKGREMGGALRAVRPMQVESRRGGRVMGPTVYAKPCTVISSVRPKNNLQSQSHLQVHGYQHFGDHPPVTLEPHGHPRSFWESVCSRAIFGRCPGTVCFGDKPAT